MIDKYYLLVIVYILCKVYNKGKVKNMVILLSLQVF